MWVIVSVLLNSCLRQVSDIGGLPSAGPCSEKTMKGTGQPAEQLLRHLHGHTPHNNAIAFSTRGAISEPTFTDTGQAPVLPLDKAVIKRHGRKWHRTPHTPAARPRPRRTQPRACDDPGTPAADAAFHDTRDLVAPGLVSKALWRRANGGHPADAIWAAKVSSAQSRYSLFSPKPRPPGGRRTGATEQDRRKGTR